MGDTTEVFGGPNEGPAKVPNIQRLLGRRPVVAARNSPGDAEMLETERMRGTHTGETEVSWT
ncbi:MAG: hypothetical protein V3U46_06410 [Acidimicrobiia bacterium]